MIERISSVQNPVVKMLASLQSAKGRRENGLFLLEGRKMLQEALQSGIEPRYVLFDGNGFEDLLALCQDAQIFQTTRSVLEKVASTVTPQGLIAALPMPPTPPSFHAPLVFLDGVQDPGNCGTIWRTCEAAGFHGIAFSSSCADPFSPKVLRSSMGAAFRIPAYKIPDTEQFLSRCRTAGWAVIASSLQGGDFYARKPIPLPFVLAIGSEARGISAQTAAYATHLVRLPMAGKTESLNAAVAAGILMYDLFAKEIQVRT